MKNTLLSVEMEWKVVLANNVKQPQIMLLGIFDKLVFPTVVEVEIDNKIAVLLYLRIWR